MKCRHCGAPLSIRLVELGSAPPSNAYLSAAGLRAPETWFPLSVLVCGRCWLGQTEVYTGREQLFSGDYAYFSSYSSTWLEHCQHYVGAITTRLGLDQRSSVAEIAANDGCLLELFQRRGIPCYGVEPTNSTARAARDKGLRIIEDFFGEALAGKLAAEGDAADLAIANNVLAHVPDINEFVAGFAKLLKSDGVATFEFPHLYRLVREHQFDTIYHEHFSYLSFTTARAIMAANGLTVFDVDELATHGGSLRVYAQRAKGGRRPVAETVPALMAIEERAGMFTADFYEGLQRATLRIKRELLRFLLKAQERGEMVIAYGAAAKGNTLLNYCGVRGDLIAYVVDRNPAKQGRYLPGSRLPIVAEARIAEDRPPWILVLPWNLSDEISGQLAYTRGWDARLIRAVPELMVF